jgi:hypothetical protein
LINAEVYQTNPSQAVADAIAGLVQTAGQDNLAPYQVLAKALQGQPKISTNVWLDTVNSYANEMGVTLGQGVANHIATAMEQAGVSSADAAKIARTYIGQMYNYNAGDTQTGFAAAAKQAIQDTFGQYGVSPSDSTMGSIMKSVMGSGADTVYSITDMANALGEQQAKQAASALFPAAAQAINEGQRVTDIMQPYFQVAHDMLGVDAQAQFAKNPSLYGFALSGQSPMSMQDFAYTLANDPKYDYQHSPAARQNAASAVMGIRNLLGLQ